MIIVGSSWLQDWSTPSALSSSDAPDDASQRGFENTSLAHYLALLETNPMSIRLHFFVIKTLDVCGDLFKAVLHRKMTGFETVHLRFR